MKRFADNKTLAIELLKKILKWKEFFLIFGILLCCVLLEYVPMSESVETSICILILIVAPSYLTYILFAKTNKDKADAELEKVYDNIRGSFRFYNYKNLMHAGEEKNIKESSDILELMLVNMKEIRDYYVLSKTQAKNSFFLAVIMCITGIVLMGIAIVAAFLNSHNLVSAIIPAVGAAIVDVIAGTAMILYKKSVDQLNHYYNSLHNNERFLSIVNIVSKASPEKQDEMYFEIVKSQILMLSKEMN